MSGKDYTIKLNIEHKIRFTKGGFEVSPYIALTELNNANIQLLDTVNKSLSEEVRLSKYGKQLDDFIENERNLTIKNAVKN